MNLNSDNLEDYIHHSSFFTKFDFLRDGQINKHKNLIPHYIDDDWNNLRNMLIVYCEMTRKHAEWGSEQDFLLFSEKKEYNLSIYLHENGDIVTRHNQYELN